MRIAIATIGGNPFMQVVLKIVAQIIPPDGSRSGSPTWFGAALGVSALLFGWTLNSFYIPVYRSLTEIEKRPVPRWKGRLVCTIIGLSTLYESL